ncbi:hypothetical protein IW261DRAFT_1556377 [Armillaria novae-zelandiae]|uniref:DUF6533 domain-containing protein n=1 Tax=Armillaria novae-zelandiae TaxID=153914 RepID=A0AA39PVA4_9AGAR|nr:hypothetical protein IW261DRAFT_1556377 [Armillaria novae-zelandiae]
MADEEIVRGLGVVRMCQLVATTIVLYDHAITFGQEVEYIWSKQISASKILFILVSVESSRVAFRPDDTQNRYLGELVLIAEGICLFLCISYVRSLSDQTIYSVHQEFSVGPILGRCFNTLIGVSFLSRCNVFFRFQGYFNAFLICVGGAVMSLRVVAMHEASKKILTLVSALLMGELISMVTVLSFSFRTITALQQSQTHACIRTGVPHYYWTFYLFPMVLETVLFGLAVSVAFKHVRERGLLTGESVLDVLFRDSIYYFIIIECAFIANAATAFYLTKHGVYDKGVFHVPWLQIPQGVSISVTILVVSRLILNLQHVYYLPIRDHSLVSSIQWRGPSDEADLPESDRLYTLNSPLP